MTNEKQDTPVRTTEEQLTEFLANWKLRGNVWPNGMPTGPLDAATWWLGRQEPQAKLEKAYAYHVRVGANLRKFLQLPADEQRLILAAWEDGMWWRGDDTHTRLSQFDGRTLFENIIAETEKMRAMGVGAYRKQTWLAARKVLERMQDMPDTEGAA